MMSAIARRGDAGSRPSRGPTCARLLRALLPALSLALVLGAIA